MKTKVLNSDSAGEWQQLINKTKMETKKFTYSMQNCLENLFPLLVIEG